MLLLPQCLKCSDNGFHHIMGVGRPKVIPGNPSKTIWPSVDGGAAGSAFARKLPPPSFGLRRDKPLSVAREADGGTLVRIACYVFRPEEGTKAEPGHFYRRTQR